MNRWYATPALAVLVALALFLLMAWLVRPPATPPDAPRLLRDVDVVMPVKDDATTEQLQAALDAAPPAPPAAPPSLLPATEAVAMPALNAAPLGAGPVVLSADVSGGGLKLGSSGVFGGFAGRGSGKGGSGTGSGGGFKGKPLVPLSTARPQMPDWACKQKLRGWVEVVFKVLPDGKVTDVRLVDADPRGVFEAAAIESVANWIYPRMDKAIEVKQRVAMDPADCAYNWQ